MSWEIRTVSGTQRALDNFAVSSPLTDFMKV